MPEPTRDVLLVEYQKAQDSAEHHDNLVGSVTSLWLGSAVLIGFVLSGIDSKGLAHHKSVLTLVGALGMWLTFLVWSWASRAAQLKKQKYERCKEIEKLLKMQQHSDVDGGRWWQDIAYTLLTALFLVTWVALLVDVRGWSSPLVWALIAAAVLFAAIALIADVKKLARRR